MDKQTLSNYGWIVICVLVLAVMLALASPFGQFVADSFNSAKQGLFDTGDSALDVGLSAVGVSNKLPCGHGRKESGDHSQKECGHFACEECGCVPASCGVEGHWSGDGKDHTTKVNHTSSSYSTPHTYKCQCEGWTVPDGGTYTMKTAINDKSVYTAGEQLPCGYTTKSNDKYEYGDYRYFHSFVYDGWAVYINTNVTDKNQETYGPILEEINGTYVTSMEYTFRECPNLTTAPIIPSHVKNVYMTFHNCTSLKTYAGSTAPDGDFGGYVIPSSVTNMGHLFSNCSVVLPPNLKQATSVTSMYNAFSGCTSLTTAPDISNCKKLTNISGLFSGCTSLKTHVGSTDADGDFGGYVIPDSVTNMYGTFSNCTNLTVAPALPSSAANINSLFSGCKNLKTYAGSTDPDGDFSNYVIPNGVTAMGSTFYKCKLLVVAPDISDCKNLTNLFQTFIDCNSLTTVPGEIPASVCNMGSTFRGCKSLTGTVKINTDIPSTGTVISTGDTTPSYGGMFYDVDFEKQNLTLAGTSTELDTYGGTGKNYCADCNGKCNGGH